MTRKKITLYEMVEKPYGELCRIMAEQMNKINVPPIKKKAKKK